MISDKSFAIIVTQQVTRGPVNHRVTNLRKRKKEDVKLYSCMNVNEGAPARLFRAPSEIRREMIGISRTIRENEEMLSVHNLLVEMIPEWAEKSPDAWIPELE